MARANVTVEIDTTKAAKAVDDLTERVKLLRSEVAALAEMMDRDLTFDEYYNRARAGALKL